MQSHGYIALAVGSVIGRDHRMVPKNCQDAFYVNNRGPYTVCIVADGCGSGAHSEVGAHIGARLVGEAVLAERDRVGSTSEIRWDRVLIDVTSALNVLARQMGESLSAVVNNYLLFTIVGVVLDEAEARFFNLGDGVVLINDQQIELGPFPDNQPPYLAYNLVGSTLLSNDPGTLAFRNIATVPLAELRYFLIGTDGVLDLIRAAGKPKPGSDDEVLPIQLFADDKCFTNEVLLNRRLQLVARDWRRRDPGTNQLVVEPGLLPDDTTMIVGKKFELS